MSKGAILRFLNMLVLQKRIMREGTRNPFLFKTAIMPSAPNLLGLRHYQLPLHYEPRS